jgi:hypothetical protein
MTGKGAGSIRASRSRVSASEGVATSVVFMSSLSLPGAASRVSRGGAPVRRNDRIRSERLVRKRGNA